MAEMIEAPVNDWIASFDGRVLEVFTPYKDGSTRFHVRLIHACAIDGTLLTVDFDRRERGFWPFREDQRALVETLVAAIESARTPQP